MNAPAQQRTDAWRQKRAGRITASCFVDAIAFTEGEGFYKSGPRKGQKRETISSPARERLKRELAFERLAGIAKHEVGARSLSWGRDLEDASLEAYMVQTGNIVEASGFLVHPRHPFIGGSPDGLIGTDGGLEAKCPMDEAVHIQTWLEGMPKDHIPQVQGNMMVTGRAWWDFTSYDPRQSERFRLYVQRIPRDDAYCADLLTKLLQFEMELRAMVKQLEAKAA
ncbi:YqaJ viral recombinase family protein [Alcaligenaceae bacterium C4P045]|nr:YqaJ viral recombinase family protein [Alcaligenaceae bacterium C4P045]